MAIEERVISSGKRPVGGGIREGRSKDGGGDAGDEGGGKKPKKLILIIGGVVLLLVIGAAAWFLFLKPSDGAAAEPEPEPELIAGEVLTVDSVSINLVDGHYLRLGMGLQLVAGGGHGEAPDPAKALDLAIALFSGHTVAEVSDPATREALKDELAAQLSEAYEHEVMDVYLTDYVTQ